MPSKFDKDKATQQSSALRMNPDHLKDKLMQLFHAHPPHPTESTDEERVAWLENQRLKVAVSRVLNEV
jgi:hypothetical protein